MAARDETLTHRCSKPETGELQVTVPPSALQSQDKSHGSAVPEAHRLLRGLLSLSIFSSVFLAQLGRVKEGWEVGSSRKIFYEPIGSMKRAPSIMHISFQIFAFGDMAVADTKQDR